MKKLLILTGFWMIAASMTAQIFVKSSDQQFVEDAIEGCFFDITQSYRLQDTATMKLYGLKGRNEFGTAKAVGVKTTDGFVVPDQIAQPWNYDDNFIQFKESHRPVLYKSIISDGEEQVIDSLTVTASQGLLHFVADSSIFGGQGLTPVKAEGNVKGWLVWLLEQKDESPKYIIYKKDADFSGVASANTVTIPNNSYTPRAGIFLIPTQSGIGTLQFQLAAIIANVEGQWKMMPVGDFSPSQQQTKPTDRQTPLTLEQIAESSDTEEVATVEEPTNGKDKKRKKKNK